LIRAANDIDVPALAIAFYRCALASLVLVPLAWRRHRNELRGLSRASRWLLVLSGVASGCHFATWVSSLSYTSIAASARRDARVGQRRHPRREMTTRGHTGKDQEPA